VEVSFTLLTFSHLTLPRDHSTSRHVNSFLQRNIGDQASRDADGSAGVWRRKLKSSVGWAEDLQKELSWRFTKWHQCGLLYVELFLHINQLIREQQNKGFAADVLFGPRKIVQRILSVSTFNH